MDQYKKDSYLGRLFVSIILLIGGSLLYFTTKGQPLISRVPGWAEITSIALGLTVSILTFWFFSQMTLDHTVRKIIGKYAVVLFAALFFGFIAWGVPRYIISNFLEERAELRDEDYETTFNCPENQTPEEQVDAVAQFISDYQKTNPNATIDEMMEYRSELLASNNCNSQ